MKKPNEILTDIVRFDLIYRPDHMIEPEQYIIENRERHIKWLNLIGQLQSKLINPSQLEEISNKQLVEEFEEYAVLIQDDHNGIEWWVVNDYYDDLKKELLRRLNLSISSNEDDDEWRHRYSS